MKKLIGLLAILAVCALPILAATQLTDAQMGSTKGASYCKPKCPKPAPQITINSVDDVNQNQTNYGNFNNINNQQNIFGDNEQKENKQKIESVFTDLDQDVNINTDGKKKYGRR